MSVKDHLGLVYPDRFAMCEHYGIKYGLYKARMSGGMSQEEALTTPLKKVARHEDVTVDHLGNIYKSEADMAKAYGLDPDFLHKRLTGGMSLKNALTKKRQIRGRVVDHKGKEYDSYSAMVKAYGKDITGVKRRLRNGWSLKDALEKDYRGGQIQDHFGNIYKTKQEMCRHYGINKNCLNHRLDQGWSLQKALETPCEYFPDKNKRKEQRLGEKRLMNNGLYAQIETYAQRHDVLIRFEDGATRHTGYKEFEKGTVGHPTLNPSGNKSGKFAGFTTKRISGQYFECTCNKCRLKAIMTPHKMMEHEKKCQ